MGSILISLADEDKADSLRDGPGSWSDSGYKLYATEGTAAWIERAGMPVQLVTKRIGKGKPDVLDVILGHGRRRCHQHAGPADKESWTASRSAGRPSSVAFLASPRSTPRGRWLRQ